MEVSQVPMFPAPAKKQRTSGLRWYQKEAIAAVFKAWETHRRVLLTMATGTGKTVIFSNIARNFVGRVLVLAHRDELISQTIDQLVATTGEAIGLEQAGFRSHKERIVVGSVQTVYRKDRLERLQKLGGFDLVIADEAHRYLAKTYKQAVDGFPNACLLGVTATPDRGDKRALGQLFDHAAYSFDILQGITAGYLVPLEGEHVTIDEIDLSKVRTVAGDLNKSELDDAVCKGVEGIVKAVLEKWPDRRAISFWPKKRSARLACERFNAIRPGYAACIDDDTPRDERRSIIAQCHRGDVQMLCNVLIATEGFDWPAASLVVNARPTKSRGLYTQIVGRGARVLRNTVDHIPGEDRAGERRSAIADSDKPKCVIADFVGDAGKHDLRSPIDVLAGNYSDAVVKVAKRLAKEEGAGDPVDQLDRAQLEVKAMAASIKASRVRHSSQTFNPFNVLHLNEVPECWKDERAVTDNQATYLLRMKVPPDALKSMTFNEAQRIIKTEELRRRKGLASYGQLKQLQRFGIEQINISKERASRAMKYLSDHSWGRSVDFSSDVLRAIALAPNNAARPR